jgi:hypothetical protein
MDFFVVVLLAMKNEETVLYLGTCSNGLAPSAMSS